MTQQQDIIKLIEELESFDLTTITNEKYVEYKNIFGKLLENEIYFPRAKLNIEERSFIRARKNDNYYLYRNLSELWCPPAHLVKHGRLNFHNDPIFYASNDAATAILEVNPNQLQFVTLLYFKLKVNEIKAFSLGIDQYEGQVVANLKDDDKMRYDFLIKHIKKVVPNNSPGLYTPTMLLSKGIRHENFDAYIYQSVANKLDGQNFAFKPEFIDNNFKFESARTIEVLNINSDETYFTRCIAEARQLRSNGDFIWKLINNCGGHAFGYQYKH